MTELTRANDLARSPRTTTGEQVTRFSYYRFFGDKGRVVSVTCCYKTHYRIVFMSSLVVEHLSRTVIAPAKQPERCPAVEGRLAIVRRRLGLSAAMIDSPRREHYTDIAWQVPI
jgi:hypothetical protein